MSGETVARKSQGSEAAGSFQAGAYVRKELTEAVKA